APCNYNNHDITYLPNGNVLYARSPNTVTEIAPDKTIVWQYISKPKEGYTGRVEVHAIQRLANGITLISENGNSRFVEVDKNGTIVKERPYTIENHDAHSETRLARLLDNGHYLACHERDATVREYDETGKVVWSYKLDLNNQPATQGHKGHGTDVYHAVRLKSGNTLIAAGSNNRLIEVDKVGQIVWSIERDELPGIRLFWVTSLEVLPNGNIVFGNTHGGDTNPQLIEVTHDKAKKVVWTLNNREAFGDDMAAAMVLDVKGKVIR
ncbi:MAG: PQQ-binding-like beta-propeller repeat protein, partial [Mucilaginibacter sp.]|nr:PQQ-binding-like beta-propeller repeat protein [Mucilaginibacter sp.]